MAVCYKKLWKLLIDKDMTRASLREATGIAPATISKMSRGESVGANVLERICASMQCNIGGIVDYVPDVNRVPAGEGDKGVQAR
jgi:DNA-binding Xre family transcriptional regulator